MIRFMATDEQAQKIAVNAIMESTPIGMGFIQYDPNMKVDYKDITIKKRIGGNSGIYIDYCGGRMVKLNMIKEKENKWCLVHPNKEYQSWISKYKTADKLVLSVDGVTII